MARQNATAARQQFNSGYWDAVYDAERGYTERTEGRANSGGGVLPSWDKAYCVGYRFGFFAFRNWFRRSDSQDAETSSDRAWKLYRAKRAGWGSYDTPDGKAPAWVA